MSLVALERAAGLDLGSYRREHVEERVRRALEREGVRDTHELARLVAADPDARSRFRRSVAVSVSSLFRDPAQFRLLEETILPPLVAAGRRIRVWSAGCANGAELYSVAMVLDRLGALERSFLLGSDLLVENIERARAGIEGVPDALQARTRWEQRDIVREGAPGGGWHLVLCRNLAIYLTEAAKSALHRVLVGALARNGVLMLGRSERLGDPRGIGLELIASHTYRSTT